MKRNNTVGLVLVIIISCFGIPATLAQEVSITIDAGQNKQLISPYIYGCNTSFDKPVQFYRNVGLRMARTNNGNNATKYNWRKKISSHPDWYNNVYANDWDQKSLDFAEDHPDIQVMWAFQLLGRVASSTAYNFNDWEYNNSQWWEGVHQNLAGGGVPNEEDPGGDALVEGDVNLYTEEWPADSTVGILDHWFGEGGLGLNKNQFLYWDMDNEPDIWNGTHDDVMSDGLLPASEFVDRFIEVAKKARAKFPEIKICGPVTTSEWQWYKWGEESIWIEGTYYCWLEYFLKRIAEEENASGIRLLDVVDLHNYPYAPTEADALQVHRMYYDTEYDYPGANGVKTINGGWDNSQTKEYIFKRIEDWLTEYFGEDHGIGVGISEWGPSVSDPNVCSVVYASILGTFANHGVEYFTPWHWRTGMWETLHLFSRYSRKYSVSGTSSQENRVSAYASVNEAADSMTLFIVNRDMTSEREVTVNLNGYSTDNGFYKTLQLSDLPAGETFETHNDNALKESSVFINANRFTFRVPALSTTAVLLPVEGVIDPAEHQMLTEGLKLYPNPASDYIHILHEEDGKIEKIILLDQLGRKVISFEGNPNTINIENIPGGVYHVVIFTKDSRYVQKLIKY